MDNSNQRVYTIGENCVGCRRCISACPVKFANTCYESDGIIKVDINSDRCISCGNCIKACDHHARVYRDDLDLFIDDLKAGGKIRMLVHPGFVAYFKNYKKIISYLRTLGVELIYSADVAMGVAIWANLKLYKQNSDKGIILSSSEIISDFVERYTPELINKLSPVHNPASCGSIYLKKYSGFQGKVAFLGSFISAFKHNRVPEGNGVDYFINFEKLENFIISSGISISEFEDTEFDPLVGCNFAEIVKDPRLGVNVCNFLPGKNLKVLDGMMPATEYLNNFRDKVLNGADILPDFIDISICKDMLYLDNRYKNSLALRFDKDEFEFNMQRIVRMRINTPVTEYPACFKIFDETLELSDFIREYEDHTDLIGLREPSSKEYRIIYNNMYKYTAFDQNINCTSCGYMSCKSMAKAIYNGIDCYEGCIRYLDEDKKIKHNELIDRNEEIRVINEEINDVLEQTLELARINEYREKRMRAVLDNLVDAVIVVNQNGLIERSNLVCEKMFGYSKDEFIGMPIITLVDDLLGKVASSLQKILEASDENEGSDSVCNKFEVYASRKDGSLFEAEVSLSQMYFEGMHSFIFNIRDISERKEVERMKNQFISTVSHELRTPLTSIRGALGLVLSGSFGPVPEMFVDLLSIANNNSLRLVNLINDILDLEKIQAGKMNFYMANHELIPILRETIRDNKTYADQFEVELEFVEPDFNYIVCADRDRLVQVFANLLSNAAKFSNSKGIVTVSVIPNGKYVRTIVSDTGIGIPDEYKDKIFDKFLQVDSSDSRQKGGTGLGLGISKSLVEKMNGVISFSSQKDIGTQFYVDLPFVNDV